MTEDVLRVGASARAALRRESFLTGAFALATTALAGIALAIQRLPTADPLLSGLLVGLAGLVALVLDVRRRDATWRQFTLRVTPGAIETGVGDARRRIAREELRHAVRAVWPARGLVLVGRRGAGRVFVPEGIERFDAIVAEVSQWGPIERSRVPDAIARTWPFIVAIVVALEAVALGSTHAPLVTLAAAILTGLAGWSLANVLRSRRMSVRGRALSLLLLVPTAWIVWRAIGLWRG